MWEKKNLIAKRFGRLIVIKEIGRTKSRRVLWLCFCDCGQETKVPTNDLTTGNTKSCGCLNRELASMRLYKHGERRTRKRPSLYHIWESMKKRCYNLNSKGYQYYGGRGITVCDEWKNSYPAFKFWAILNGYQEGLTIDRINNDGNYEPSNCQWLTNSENAKKRWRDKKRETNI